MENGTSKPIIDTVGVCKSGRMVAFMMATGKTGSQTEEDD